MADTYSLDDLDAKHVQDTEVQHKNNILRRMIKVASSLLTVAVVTESTFQ